jgi:hypothetical protein
VGCERLVRLSPAHKDRERDDDEEVDVEELRVGEVRTD